MEESTYFSTDLHAITAIVNIAFDIAAIATYAQGYFMRGPYYESKAAVPEGFVHEYKTLFRAAVGVSLALFLVGCLLRAVLAYKYTRCWATAARASVHLELPYQAYRGHRPNTNANACLVRMLKMVELSIEMPQTCLAVIVYVLSMCIKGVYDVDTPNGLASSRDLDILLLLTAVFGIITSSVAAAEQLVDKPWSLWYNSNFMQHRQTGKLRYGILRWLATAVSLTSHILLCLMLSPQLQAYVFVVLFAWFVVCTVAYYISCGMLYRSIKCGYLSVLMNLPFNPYAGRSDGPDVLPSSVDPTCDANAQIELSPATKPQNESSQNDIVHDQDVGRPVQVVVPDGSQNPSLTLHSKPSWKAYWLSGTLVATYCITAFALGVIQARSCWFTTYRCISAPMGYDVDCKRLSEQPENHTYWRSHRSMTGKCIAVGTADRDWDTPLEPRIGGVTAAFVVLDAVLFVAMSVLSAQGEA